MAVGGFKFAQEKVTYYSEMFPTKYDWALAIHKARCLAFLRAQNSAGDEWERKLLISNDMDEEYLVDGVWFYAYITDFFKTTNKDYAAFLSVFTHKSTGEEYCIITSNGMNWTGSYAGDGQYGLCFDKARLPWDPSSDDMVYSYYSMAHGYSENGFDLTGANMFDSVPNVDGCLPILPICGFDGNRIGQNNTTADNYYSLVANPSIGVQYSFGYAVRGRAIETFYKTSDGVTGAGWHWSIIGHILKDPVGLSEIAYCSYGTGGGEISPMESNYCPRYSQVYCPFACIASDGKMFPNFSNPNATRLPKLSPGFIPSLCKSTLPTYIPFSAAAISLVQNNGVIDSEDFAGINGGGEMCAGFIDPEILRVVSAQACQIGGATLDGKKFVCPEKQFVIHDGDDFGVVLGWDASNESIL